MAVPVKRVKPAARIPLNEDGEFEVGPAPASPCSLPSIAYIIGMAGKSALPASQGCMPARAATSRPLRLQAPLPRRGPELVFSSRH